MNNTNEVTKSLEINNMIKIFSPIACISAIP